MNTISPILPGAFDARRPREPGEAKKEWVSFFASPLKLLCGCLLVGFAVLLLAGCRETQERLHMGAGPGLPLLLAETLADRLLEKQGEASSEAVADGATGGADISDTDVRTVGDCCAAVSQWALSSRELDMAIMCPDAARILVEKNADYVLAGPVLLDGDALVRKPAARQQTQAGREVIQRVGMSHQRSAQRALIQETLGQDVEIIEMLPAALLYALERNAVDAIVLDRLTAAKSAMPLREYKRSNRSQVTQVLVLHKLFAEDRQPLAAALREAVAMANERLQTISALQSFNQGGAAEWTTISTRFVSPLDSP